MYANGYVTSSSSGHSAITQSKHQSKDSEKAATSMILPSAVLRWLTRRSIAWFGRIICKVTIQTGHWMKGMQLWMLYLMESEKENMFYGTVQWKLVTSSLHRALYNSKWSSRPRGKRFKGNNMGKTVKEEARLYDKRNEMVVTRIN